MEKSIINGTLLNEKVLRGQRPAKLPDLQKLKELGVTDIINLQSGAHEFFNNDTYEFVNVSDLGMTEHNIYCSDFLPPKDAQFRKVCEIILKAKGKVYVHCLHGKDRTGMICAMLRMQLENWSFDNAREEMYSKGFHKFPYLWWVFYLSSYEK